MPVSNIVKLASFFQKKYINTLNYENSNNEFLSSVSDYIKEITFIKSFAAAKKNKGVATKTNPKLWSRCKSEAKSKMGGKHSARAMQLALKLYKKRGGGFKGKKPTAKTNKMKKWTKQKWMYLSDYKKKSKNKADDHNNAEPSIEDMNLAKGRYLPESKWKSLTPSEREATDRKKKQQGKHKQYVPNS